LVHPKNWGAGQPDAMDWLRAALRSRRADEYFANFVSSWLGPVGLASPAPAQQALTHGCDSGLSSFHCDRFALVGSQLRDFWQMHLHSFELRRRASPWERPRRRWYVDVLSASHAERARVKAVSTNGRDRLCLGTKARCPGLY